MKVAFLFSVIAIYSILFSSCETVDKDPQPPRDELSSMPHNIPASWEGSAGLPGGLGGGGQGF